LHWGATKTWYGVPGSHAENFEQVMKQNASELFERSPDLLHHLATIMNPNTLTRHQVPIFKLNQEAGEFVVTFPRAYHAGFNQGFNFAEAVNFCPADWMNLGRSAIENYKLLKRHTVFSHDELVCKVATNRTLIEINIAFAIQRELSAMYNMEKQCRTKFMEKSATNITTRQFSPELLTDDDRTCDFCKTTCYISMIKCICSPDKLVCLNHYEHMKEICKSSHKCKSISIKSHLYSAKHHQYTLYYKYTLEEISNLSAKLKRRLDDYNKWCFLVESIVLTTDGNANTIKKIDYDSDDSVIFVPQKVASQTTTTIKKPLIHKLSELLDEAIANKYPRSNSTNKTQNLTNHSLFNMLEQELDQAVRCQAMCAEIISAYKNKSTSTLTLTRLKDFFSLMSSLSCDLEYSQREMILYIYNESCEQKRIVADLTTAWRLDERDKLKKAIGYASFVRFDSDECDILATLRLMERQSVWLDEVSRLSEDPSTLTIDVLSGLCDRLIGERLLESDNPMSKGVVQMRYEELDELLNIARAWDNRARRALEAVPKTRLALLEDILEEGRCIPIHMDRCVELELVVDEAKKWIKNF
jgi:histone demethylase JARID1